MIKIDENTYNKMPDEIKKCFMLLPNKSKEEVVKLFPNTKSGQPSLRKSDGFNNEIYGNGIGIKEGQFNGEYGDEGSASRFFYVAKPSQEERNFGLYGFEEIDGGSYKFREDGSLDGKIPKKRNIHPTVKPIELMRYLVKMITPPDGVCLDPYVGSGTTAVACKIDKFDYIGIEREKDYVDIAEARIEAVKDYDVNIDTKTAIKEAIQEDKEKEAGIIDIFDFL